MGVRKRDQKRDLPRERGFQVVQAFGEFVEDSREALNDSKVLGTLPSDAPTPLAVLDDPACSWVFLRVPANLRVLLDERERQVAIGVVHDLPNKAIGGSLGTMKSILQRIFVKLGIRSRLKLALLAVSLLAEEYRVLTASTDGSATRRRARAAPTASARSRKRRESSSRR